MTTEIVEVIYSMWNEPYGGYHETAVRGCTICDVRAHSRTDHGSDKGYIGRCDSGGWGFFCEECVDGCECHLCTHNECQACHELHLIPLGTLCDECTEDKKRVETAVRAYIDEHAHLTVRYCMTWMNRPHIASRFGLRDEVDIEAFAETVKELISKAEYDADEGSWNIKE